MASLFFQYTPTTELLTTNVEITTVLPEHTTFQKATPSSAATLSTLNTELTSFTDHQIVTTTSIMKSTANHEKYTSSKPRTTDVQAATSDAQATTSNIITMTNINTQTTQWDDVQPQSTTEKHDQSNDTNNDATETTQEMAHSHIAPSSSNIQHTANTVQSNPYDITLYTESESDITRYIDGHYGLTSTVLTRAEEITDLVENTSPVTTSSDINSTIMPLGKYTKKYIRNSTTSKVCGKRGLINEVH